MNRLRSIIALQVYVCMCGVCRTLFKTKRERERESFDLSECIWHSKKETVVRRNGGRKREKKNIISRACRQEVFVFYFSSLSSATCSLFSFGLTLIFICFSGALRIYSTFQIILSFIQLNTYIYMKTNIYWGKMTC